MSHSEHLIDVKYFLDRHYHYYNYYLIKYPGLKLQIWQQQLQMW
jgi:hypothetical protein